MNEYIQKPPSGRKRGADAGKSGAASRERITPPEPDGSEGATYMIRGKMMSVFSRKSLREHVPVRFTGILYYIPTKN